MSGFKNITVTELQDLLGEGAVLVDVRARHGEVVA